MIFCEGQKTEPGYLRSIKRSYGRTLIEVEIVEGVGTPMTIAKKAKEEIESQRGTSKNHYERNDEVWVVFDRDEHPHFTEAVQICQDAGIEVARSNPCFELWLMLHIQEFDGPRDRHQMQAALANVRQDYDKSGSKELDFDDLIGSLEEAEDRAEKQLLRRQDEGSPFDNPSTTVGELTKSIRNAHASSH